jgi:hypothetical protein
MFDGATGAVNNCTFSNNVKPISGPAGRGCLTLVHFAHQLEPFVVTEHHSKSP